VIARAARQLLAVLGIALLPALVSGAIQLRWNEPEQLAPGDVTVAQARGWGEKVMWVDARPRADFLREHIPGALLLNEHEWEKLVPDFLDEWEPEKIVVVYCAGGGCDASHAVAERIRTELKIENVHVLKGGWSAWRPE
jgi:rhodanese-related sulfurtransferase